MEQNNRKIEKQPTLKEQQNYFLKRFFFQLLLFFLAFGLCAVKSWKDVVVALSVSAVCSVGLSFGERNRMFKNTVDIPKVDFRKMWNKKAGVFFVCWLFFAALFYVLRVGIAFSAGFLVLDLIGGCLAAALSIYLSYTTIAR